MSVRFKFVAALLFALGVIGSVNAHNGHITTAEPISNITVDGDLSDWPSTMKTHAISTVLFLCDGTTAEEGYSGRYRVGFDADTNAIYVAVEIEDDAIELDGIGNEDWNSRDGCELFLSMEHSEKQTAPAQFVYRGKPYATFNNAPDEKLAKAVKVARSSDDTHILYEWRVDLETLYDGKVDLAKGTVVGFDVAYLDRDSKDKYSFYSSSPGKWKHLNASELGDLVVPAADGEVVKLAGQATWSKSNIRGPELLRIRSVENEAMFFQLPLVTNGQFMASIPAGEYQLTAASKDAEGVSSTPHLLTVRKDTLLEDPIRFEIAP